MPWAKFLIRGFNRVCVHKFKADPLTMPLILKSLWSVFRKPSYAILAIVVTGLVLLVSIWLQNRVFLAYLLTSELFSWAVKIKIFWTSLGTFKTSFTIGNQIVIICLAILSGINLSLLIFYFKTKAKTLKLAGASGLGLGLGLLGVGCGACGSIILSSLFGLTATAGFIGFLPLNGLEFDLAGIIILFISIYLLAKKISQPEVC